MPTNCTYCHANEVIEHFCRACGLDNRKQGSAVDRHVRKLMHWVKRYSIEHAFRYLDDERGESLYRHIADTIVQLDADSVLDVGCWHGNLLKRLSRIRHYVGFDMSIPAVENARRATIRDIPVDLRVGDYHDLPVETRHFDVVYFGGVLSYTEVSAIELLRRYARKYSPYYIIVQEPVFQLCLDDLADAFEEAGLPVVRRVSLNIHGQGDRIMMVLEGQPRPIPESLCLDCAGG